MRSYSSPADRCTVTIQTPASYSEEQRANSQCMRRAVINGMCRQHARMTEPSSSPYTDQCLALADAHAVADGVRSSPTSAGAK